MTPSRLRTTMASLARSSSDAYSRASSSDHGRVRWLAHATGTPYDPRRGRASDGTLVHGRWRSGVAALASCALLLGKDVGFVSRGPVHSRYGHVVEPQIHAELCAMMDQMVHHHGAQHCRTRHREHSVAAENQLPGFSEMRIGCASNGVAGLSDIAIECFQQFVARCGRQGREALARLRSDVEHVAINGLNGPLRQFGNMAGKPGERHRFLLWFP